jgi:carbonic anhydrase
MLRSKVLVPFAFASVVIISVNSGVAYSENKQGQQSHWGYTGKYGPGGWSKIGNENQVCAMGQTQSPIDINENSAKKDKSLPQLIFSYLGIPLKIWNNGHTIQVNYPKGSNVKIGSVTYDLLQFHFHTPSEHALDGKRADMEVHFVNAKEDGSLAVVGVLMKKGKKNESLEALFDHLPKKEGPEETVADAKLNPMDFLPKDNEYYTYQGSLTTPPCSERVSWFVMKDEIEVSSDQIKKFRKIFAMNARPLQALSKRVIEEKD